MNSMEREHMKKEQKKEEDKVKAERKVRKEKLKSSKSSKNKQKSINPNPRSSLKQFHRFKMMNEELHIIIEITEIIYQIIVPD